jgi:hypothetical protein
LPRSHVGKYIRIYLIADTYIKHSELSWTICTCTRYIVYNEVLIVIFLDLHILKYTISVTKCLRLIPTGNCDSVYRWLSKNWWFFSWNLRVHKASPGVLLVIAISLLCMSVKCTHLRLFVISTKISFHYRKTIL